MMSIGTVTSYMANYGAWTDLASATQSGELCFPAQYMCVHNFKQTCCETSSGTA